jgi:hypothetical protein
MSEGKIDVSLLYPLAPGESLFVFLNERPSAIQVFTDYEVMWVYADGSI